jgi:hypothetical protein
MHHSIATHDRATARARAPAHGTGLREWIGDAIGRWASPAIAAISRSRNARMFHPRGYTFAGRLFPVENTELPALARRFDGHVLARVSAALWKGRPQWPDVLGIALRIRRTPVRDHRPADDDQDLLFATIRSPLTMVLSPFATDATDFVHATYWAVSPFATPTTGRVQLRLRALEEKRGPGPRIVRLREAVEVGRARWRLEARRTLTLAWHPLAHLVLERELAIDDAALRFDPFCAGLGIVPVGLVHAIRRAVYAASQAARPASDADAEANAARSHRR